MKRSWLFTGILAVGLLAVWMIATRTQRRSANLQAPTIVAEHGILRISVHASGAVNWAVRTPVHVPIAGRLDQLLVQEGQSVETGQRVALISSPERAILIDQAQTTTVSPDLDWESVYRPIPILAPHDGLVWDLSATVGQHCLPQQPLFWIADQPIARGRIDELDLQFVAEGRRATLSFFAVPGLVITTKVTRVRSHIPHQGDRPMHEVIVNIDPLPPAVRPGMGVTMKLDGPDRPAAFLVPDTAITQWDRQTGVIRVGTTTNPYFHPVTTGLSDGTTTEILAGLEPGDVIWADANWTPPGQARRNAASVPLVPYTRRNTP
ncbi:MAG: efflux RND transporter periplasmic adaptor subunit [Kiritimatiellia bacterium]